MDIMRINNLNFSYEKKQVISDFSLNIEAGKWVSIVGPNSSGKSTLVRILACLIKTPCNIDIDGIRLDERTVMKIRSKMGFIFDNPDNMFIGETVKDDIAFGLENTKVPRAEIEKRISHVAKLLDIENLLECDPHRLSGGEKQKVALASALVMNVKILILDDALSMINPYEKKEILSILKTLHDTTDITLITVTSDLEEVLYSDHLVVMNYGVKVIEGNTLDVLKLEKIFIDLEMKLPFMVDFSLKLKDYSLVDDVILDMKELVNRLWL